MSGQPAPTEGATATGASTRVLFVDDEPRILDGLRRVLHGRMPNAELTFAGGGDAALDAFARLPFDLIVTDLKMPGMDGPELLERVRALAPATVRVVLSGQEEIEGSVRAVGVAHQALSKPCDPDVLAERVARIAALRELVPEPVLRERLVGLSALLARPSSLETLEHVLHDPAVRTASLYPLVLTDVALAAAVFRLAATGFFGTRHPAPSLEEATAALGLGALRALARAGVLAHPIAPLSPALRDRVEAIDATAVREARRVRQSIGGRERAELGYAAALLGGLGELAWISAAVERGEEPSDHVDPLLARRMGAYLLGIWGGPTQLVERIAERTLFDQDASAATGRNRKSAA